MDTINFKFSTVFLANSKEMAIYSRSDNKSVNMAPSSSEKIKKFES